MHSSQCAWLLLIVTLCAGTQVLTVEQCIILYNTHTNIFNSLL